MADNLIKSHELVSGKPGPCVLVVAGVHGDEYEPILAARNMIESLNGTLTSGSMIVVPLANENAFLQLDRCGTDHEDLARVCPGDAAGSVTFQAAFELSQLIRQADYLIDMHTGGLTFDIFPTVGYMLSADPVLLEKQRELAIATGLPLIWGTDSKPNGRTLSVARDCGIPALYFEYGGGTGFKSHVAAAYKQAVEGILIKIGMLSSDQDQLTDKWMYWLEDYRSDSGYLQGNMPSPIEGMFVAEVAIGDRVVEGQRLGYVIDPIQNHSYEVHAPRTGLVLLLRCRIYVKKGDALGAIVEAIPQEKTVVHGS